MELAAEAGVQRRSDGGGFQMKKKKT